MEGKPPLPSGMQKPPLDRNINNASAPISRAYDTPQDTMQGMVGPTPHMNRGSSRGSNYGPMDEPNDHMYINVNRNQGPNIQRLQSTVNKSNPLLPPLGRNQPESYRKTDPDNPMGYGPDENLRKLRNNVYAKHNYGEQADDPFKEINLQEMNDDDERERQRIQQLEANIKAQKTELEKSKMKLEKKQLYDLYEQETRLLDRLDEIKRYKEEEAQINERLRKEVVNIKLKQKKDEEEKKNIDRMAWNLERDTKMEEIVKKKLELERLQDNSKYIDDVSKRRQLELEQIDVEMKSRDLADAELLQKALNHADYLQDQIESGAIDENFQAKIVNTLSGNKDDPENKKMREELLEELKAKILQQKERKTMENQKFIQDLNMKRMQFSEAEKKINEQKLLHEALSRRGVDFLSELELGTAPPMEYVINNLNIEERQVNRKEPFSIKEVVENTKNNLETNHERLERLKREKIESDQYVSKISFKPEPIFIPENTQEVIDYILDIVITNAFDEVSMYDKYVEGLRKKTRVMRQREPIQEARIGFYSDRIAVKEVHKNFLDQ